MAVTAVSTSKSSGHIQAGCCLSALATTLALLFALPSGASAAYPGENGKIAFERATTGGPHIFSINPDGTEETDLTPTLQARAPAYSPDGSRIAFLGPGTAGDLDLWVMNEDGTDQQRLFVRNDSRLSPPTWSPNGQKIAVQNETSNFHASLKIIDSDSGAVLDTLTPAPVEGTTSNSFLLPAWDPTDATDIAVLHNRCCPTGNIRNDLATISTAGGGPSYLTSDVTATTEANADWAPDGGKLIFDNVAEDGEPGEGMFTVPASGGTRTPVGEGVNPVYSPDGAKLAFGGFGDDSLKIYTSPATTYSPELLAPGARPSWQPIVSDDLVVNTIADGADTDTDDERCDSDGTQADNQCTLRAAIQEANARGGADDISFDLPGGGVPAITPASPLPKITGPVEIDGTTQPVAAQVRLVGTEAGGNASGLFLSGGDSTVRGLQIGGFDHSAIVLKGGGDNVVAGNILGSPDANPSAAGLTSNRYGVTVVGSDGNRIGGLVPADMNAIQGIRPAGSPNPTGALEKGVGILVRGDSRATAIKGNEIGGSPFGVVVSGADNTEVGGPEASAGNVLGSNLVGVLVTGTEAKPTDTTTIERNAIGAVVAAEEINPLAGVIVAGSATDVHVGTPGAGNLIFGNAFGVMVHHARDTSVESNELGPTGGASANGVGVHAHGARGLEVGSALGGNTIIGSRLGVLARGGDDVSVAGNTVDRAAAGPAGGGIVIADAGGPSRGKIEIGGPGALGNNLRNLALGVHVVRSEGLSIEGGKIEDGALGVNVTMSTVVRVRGLDLDSNLLGLSVNNGPLADPRFPQAAYDAFSAELAELDEGGEYQLALAMADAFSGHEPSPRRDGKFSIDVRVTRSLIHGGGTGALISARTKDVSLGSDRASDANQITDNGDTGVGIPGEFERANQVRIMRNVIERNGMAVTVPGLVGLNVDVGDDLARTPFGTPELTRAEIDGDEVKLEGTLSARPSTEYSIAIYLSDRCGAGGQGEATTYVEKITEDTNARGKAKFETSVPVSTADHYTAIATPTEAGRTGSTGELAGCREAA